MNHSFHSCHSSPEAVSTEISTSARPSEEMRPQAKQHQNNCGWFYQPQKWKTVSLYSRKADEKSRSQVPNVNVQSFFKPGRGLATSIHFKSETQTNQHQRTQRNCKNWLQYMYMCIYIYIYKLYVYIYIYTHGQRWIKGTGLLWHMSKMCQRNEVSASVGFSVLNVQNCHPRLWGMGFLAPAAAMCQN